MVTVNLKLSREEIRVLENIIDKTFDVREKIGVMDSGRDLFSGELLSNINLDYGRSNVILQATLNRGHYDVKLDLNKEHPNYISFLEECRTKMRRVYDELTSSRTRVASAI